MNILGSKVLRILKKLFLLLGILIVVSICMIWYSNRAALDAADGKLYDTVDEIPLELSGSRVALVFGCSKHIGNRENLYFKYRIQAAIELWDHKLVRGFIVSGDNSRETYNEPEDMKAALVEGGVPADKIVCDYAGLRTLDSIVRLKKIFGEDKAIIVSQKFHNERAAYLAESYGLDIIGYNAQMTTGPTAKKNSQREYLARVKMVLDVFFGKEPKFLGDKEELGF